MLSTLAHATQKDAIFQHGIAKIHFTLVNESYDKSLTPKPKHEKETTTQVNIIELIICGAGNKAI